MWGANSSTIVITPLAYAAKAACTLPVLKPSMNWRTGALTSSWLARMVAGAQRTTASNTTNTCFIKSSFRRNSLKWPKYSQHFALIGTLPASYAHFLARIRLPALQLPAMPQQVANRMLEDHLRVVSRTPAHRERQRLNFLLGCLQQRLDGCSVNTIPSVNKPRTSRGECSRAGSASYRSTNSTPRALRI